MRSTWPLKKIEKKGILLVGKDNPCFYSFSRWPHKNFFFFFSFFSLLLYLEFFLWRLNGGDTVRFG